MYKIVLWLTRWLSDYSKVKLANTLLTDTHISNKVAEEMIIKIVKSDGNKITDFVVRD